MVGKLSLATALLAIGTFFGPSIASSAPTVPQTAITQADHPLVQEVQWGWGHCRRWRNECAERWGWGTRHFRWCVQRHGC
jgi:hypothetical protein